MSATPEAIREALGGLDHQGIPTFRWQLSATTLGDAVQVRLPPKKVLPVIFVPGIMGTNLMDLEGGQVWRLDTTAGIPIGLARRMIFQGPAERQRRMHPERTRVDPGGSVPRRAAGSVVGTSREETETIFRDQRAWGEVAEGSYHNFLLWLEDRLNGQTFNPARWSDFSYAQPAMSAVPMSGQPQPEPELLPGLSMALRGLPEHASEKSFEQLRSDELIARARFRMPVYACGYNWLASNSVAAERLAGRIDEVISRHNRNGTRCQQVVLITHSMGGLVARRCSQLSGMHDKIAGIVHGVMPATGAPVAYRRCKLGMSEESLAAGWVIGSNGREVTAVFSQAPGALQLLPTQLYRPQNASDSTGGTEWLAIQDTKQQVMERLPGNGDPFESIYLESDRWWGLVRPEWLRPGRGVPLSWTDYVRNIREAQSFHAQLGTSYHPNTFSFYGVDPHSGVEASKGNSFESITWTISQGMTPSGNAAGMPVEEVPGLSFEAVRDDGRNPLYVGGRTEVTPSYGWGPGRVYESSHWQLRCEMQDGNGDGTVPQSSGRAPLLTAGSSIRQQFRLTGFEHEQSYRNHQAQLVTLYSLMKIAAEAKQQ
ncbi:esterase/lipase family protein [Alkalisalibacterium limincola]|uniref:Alpha/beta hydrolase n=1 Tax=Alkalisalibacterium limincola TaxID=2699169 RepID=A0A5C8KR23_9GAMM|nr:alpha/beta hydrolase [Alkalisalibacterium limincola]TXK62306.1 alpha/beta hydrolase [Alkalisalibacterium limincola]